MALSKFGADIRFDDRGILYDVDRRAVAEHRAVMQNDEAPDNRKDDAQQVLNDNYGHSDIRNFVDEIESVCNLTGIQAGMHLVKEQKARLHGQALGGSSFFRSASDSSEATR